MESGNMSINTEMTALADAIRAKSGTTGKLSIAGMTTAVNSIVITPGEGDVDLSVVTVTAADILKGKVAVGADGNQITGEIETVEASSDGTKVTVPAGFHAASAEFDISAGTTVDLSFVTAAASDILAGKVGVDKDGNPVNGTIQTVTASLTDNVITVPAGYHEEQTLTVTEAAAPTVSENVVTVPKGYNTTKKEVTVGTAKAAETITPGTANHTVPAGTYLSGDLTIKGEPNWKEENIADGVSMWGKVGTFKGGSSIEFGYIDDKGKFQAIDLSVFPPVDIGDAVEAQLVYFFLPSDPYLSISSAGLTEYNTVYGIQTVDEEIYPDFYMTFFGSSSGLVVEFDITINRWVLRKDHDQPIDYRAVSTGLDGLTGQWEAVSNDAIDAVSVPVLTKLIDFELPEWNPKEN
jgi:hypothetical protein